MNHLMLQIEIYCLECSINWLLFDASFFFLLIFLLVSISSNLNWIWPLWVPLYCQFRFGLTRLHFALNFFLFPHQFCHCQSERIENVSIWLSTFNKPISNESIAPAFMPFYVNARKNGRKKCEYAHFTICVA